MNNAPPNPHGEGQGRTGPAGVGDKRLLPLTVWLCSDDTGPITRKATTSGTAPSSSGRRPQDQVCAQHRQAVGAQLARHLVETCTRPGDLVVEAFASSATTIITAVQSGRDGAALVPHFPLAQHIGACIRAELPEALRQRAGLRPVRPDQMARGLADRLGEVALVVAAPPAYEVGGRVPKAAAGAHGCPACRADLWMLDGEQMHRFLFACWRVLKPGGVLAVITTARHRQDGRLHDPAPRIIQHASGLGLRYVQHVIALRVPIDGDSLAVQYSPGELAQLRDAASRALPPKVSVHADVCLFTKPASAGAGGAR
ncbi:hypothetical protein ACFVH6_23400 [Spirillospora sp. NPDC127200]